MIVYGCRGAAAQLLFVTMRHLAHGELRVERCQFRNESLDRLIVAPAWSQGHTNGDDSAVADAMSSRCFGEDRVHQPADFRMRLLLRFQAATAVIDQQRTNIFLLLMLEIIERKLNLKPLARPGNQLVAVVALLAGGVARREVQQTG